MMAIASLVLLSLGRSVPVAQSFGFRGYTLVLFLPFATVGALVASRRRENAVGWILLAVGVIAVIQVFGAQWATFSVLHPGLPAGPALAWLQVWLWVPLLGALGIFLFLLFPTGHPPTAGWRAVAWLGAVAIAVFSAGIALAPGAMQNVPASFHNPFAASTRLDGVLTAVGAVLYVASFVLALASLILRFRRSRGDEREQIKWLLVGGTVLLLGLLSNFPIAATSGGTGGTGKYALAPVLVMIGAAAIPVACGFAVLKYRLYDIDLVISRAVAYGALAAFFTAVYVAIVVGVGALVSSRANTALTVAAAAVIAVAFQPARERARRFANRLVYGDRATPYEVLSSLSDRLGGAYSLEEVLPRIARSVSEGTGARRVTVWLRSVQDLEPAAAWPPSPSPPPVPLVSGEMLPDLGPAQHAFAVRHQDELLGAIVVHSSPAEPLTPDAGRLIADMASQAGLVLRNVQLLADLQASRHRLVLAQDEERRRLERDIHDGAQQQLVALNVKLGLLHGLIRRDPSAAEELAAQLRSESTHALEDLRDLARGIYPPLLADQGLRAALLAQVKKGSLDVRIDADGIGRYPPEAEAAVYFCSLEALQNVAKYSGVQSASVRVSASDGDLEFTIQDEGHGFDAATTPLGAGMRNMADRLAALGGKLLVESIPGRGTTVAGRVPVEVSSTMA